MSVALLCEMYNPFGESLPNSRGAVVTPAGFEPAIFTLKG
jgi:hypothetical protein